MAVSQSNQAAIINYHQVNDLNTAVLLVLEAGDVVSPSPAQPQALSDEVGTGSQMDRWIVSGFY